MRAESANRRSIWSRRAEDLEPGPVAVGLLEALGVAAHAARDAGASACQELVERAGIWVRQCGICAREMLAAEKRRCVVARRVCTGESRSSIRRRMMSISPGSTDSCHGREELRGRRLVNLPHEAAVGDGEGADRRVQTVFGAEPGGERVTSSILPDDERDRPALVAEHDGVRSVRRRACSRRTRARSRGRWSGTATGAPPRWGCRASTSSGVRATSSRGHRLGRSPSPCRLAHVPCARNSARPVGGEGVARELRDVLVRELDSRAPRFSSRCATEAVPGMANTAGERSTQASATCAGVAPCRSATGASAPVGGGEEPFAERRPGDEGERRRARSARARPRDLCSTRLKRFCTLTTPPSRGARASWPSSTLQTPMSRILPCALEVGRGRPSTPPPGRARRRGGAGRGRCAPGRAGAGSPRRRRGATPGGSRPPIRGDRAGGSPPSSRSGARRRDGAPRAGAARPSRGRRSRRCRRAPRRAPRRGGEAHGRPRGRAGPPRCRVRSGPWCRARGEARRSRRSGSPEARPLALRRGREERVASRARAERPLGHDQAGEIVDEAAASARAGSRAAGR